MGEISFLGYLIIFIFSIFIKLIWAIIGVTMIAWFQLINQIVEEMGGELWKIAELSKYSFLYKFILILILGQLSLWFFGGFILFFSEANTDGIFFEFFPFIKSLID